MDDDSADSDLINNIVILEVSPDEYCIPIPSACLSSFLPFRLSVCLRKPGLMPAFFFLFLWYPVAISSSATCRQLVRLEALCIQKHPQCQAANARQLLLVSSTESCSPPKRKVTSRPSDTHRGWILCQLECRELGKKGGGQL